MYPYSPSTHTSVSWLRLVPRTHLSKISLPVTLSNLSPVVLRPLPPSSRLHPGCLDSRYYTCCHHRLHPATSAHVRLVESRSALDQNTSWVIVGYPRWRFFRTRSLVNCLSFLRNEQVLPDGFKSLYERFRTRRDQKQRSWTKHEEVPKLIEK